VHARLLLPTTLGINPWRECVGYLVDKMEVHNETKSLRVYEHESPGLSIQIDNPEA